MAEGGVYPWKRQRPDGVVYTDYRQILKPLPPPPDGLMWVKRRVTTAEQEGQLEEQDGNGDGDEPVAMVAEALSSSSEARFMWELVERPSRPGPEEGGEEPPLVDLGEEEEGPADFILHTVLPTDTMAGLRLRYKVTAAELRKHNDFAGELFHVLDNLKIPISGREEHVKQFKQVMRRCVKGLGGLPQGWGGPCFGLTDGKFTDFMPFPFYSPAAPDQGGDPAAVRQRHALPRQGDADLLPRGERVAAGGGGAGGMLHN